MVTAIGSRKLYATRRAARARDRSESSDRSVCGMSGHRPYSASVHISMQALVLLSRHVPFLDVSSQFWARPWFWTAEIHRNAEGMACSMATILRPLEFGLDY